MSSVSFTKAQFLNLTSQEKPLRFSEGARVTLSDVSFTLSEKVNSIKIIQELGKIFEKSYVCLSPIEPESIKIEQTNPLTLKILSHMTLQSADRTNWLTPSLTRLSFRSVNVLHDVDTISKKSGSLWQLERKTNQSLKNSIENVMYQSHDGTDRSFLYMLQQTHTDGIVILRDGSIIYENYFEGHNQHTPHIQFSATKSLIGMIVAQLIVEGVINPETRVGEYIPELAKSGVADAKVIEVLDMTNGTQYNEDYSDPESDVRKHMFAAGYLSQPAGYSHSKTLRSFLPTIKKEGEHNQIFHYVSANTEVLSWIVEKATELKGRKRTVNELFCEKIWSQLGVEQDATIIKDSEGNASWAGGFNAITLDMARLGQMILNRGRAESKQLLSKEAFEFMTNRDLRPQYAQSIFAALLPVTKGWSYANQFWWTHNEHEAFTAVGIHGQLLYIDPKARMVIAKNSSHPEAIDFWLGHDEVVAVHAMAKQHLSKLTANL